MTVDNSSKAEVAWNDAVKTLHGATRRTELTLAEVPAPNRLAPYALALSLSLIHI